MAMSDRHCRTTNVARRTFRARIDQPSVVLVQASVNRCWPSVYSGRRRLYTQGAASCAATVSKRSTVANTSTAMLGRRDVRDVTEDAPGCSLPQRAVTQHGTQSETDAASVQR